MSEYLKLLDKFGFAIVSQFIDQKRVGNLIKNAVALTNSLASEQSERIYGIRNLLNLSPEIKDFANGFEIKNLVSKVLGANAKPVRAIFFDKTPDANWKVPWHQDLTIAVKEKRETVGFTAWTRKAGIQHVQPPISLLERMLTVRIHLDDADESNGALKVLPTSHNCGRLSADEIQKLKGSIQTQVCNVNSGEAFLMRPLLVHSSSAGTNPKHRRVVHIEFAAEDLPNNLQWYGS